MKAASLSRRDRLRHMLADLRMPGGLEALDAILQGVDGGTLTAAEAARIGTGTLALVVPVTGAGASRPPDLLVRDLNLNATGTAGFVGNLSLVVGDATNGISEIAAPSPSSASSKSMCCSG